MIGAREEYDVAVLKINRNALGGQLLRPLAVGMSSDLSVGQSVMAIGNPFGLDRTMTMGVVSALGREVEGAGGRPITDCIQTDATINPGNSGGPLLDSQGRLIGVNTAIYSPSGGGNVGIGFAIPVDTVRRVVNQILKYGDEARPTIGAKVLNDAQRNELARSLRRQLEGALVVELVPGSPAERAGLKPSSRGVFGDLRLGDLITAVNGSPVRTNEDLLCGVEEAAPGETVVLTVMRSCDPRRVERVLVQPTSRPARRRLRSCSWVHAHSMLIAHRAHARLR